MTIKEYLGTPEGKKQRIPFKLIFHYLDKGLIHNPLTNKDLDFLRAVNAVWTDRSTVGAMLTRYSFWDRELLSATWDLSKQQVRIFGYGLFGVRDDIDEQNGPVKKVKATPALVSDELFRCKRGLTSKAIIKKTLRRAKDFPERIKKRFGMLICPHCKTQLAMEIQLGETQNNELWTLSKIE